MLAALCVVFVVGAREAGAADDGGVPAGSLQLFPGLRLEFGLDTNPLYESPEEEPRPSGALLVNPYMGVRTPEPRMVDLTADLGAAWEQFLAGESGSGLSTGANEQSGLDLEAGLGLRLNPRGLVSVAPSDRLAWATSPNLNAQGDPFRVLQNDFDLEVALHPGGYGDDERLGISGEAGVTYRTWRYDQYPDYDHDAIGGRLELQWNFLPKTAVFALGSVDKMSYRDREVVVTMIDGASFVDNIDSFSARGSAGFTGLLTRRLSLLGSAGYGVGNYDSGRDPRTYLAHVDLGVHLNPNARLNLGWEHNFEDTLLSSFITYHRAYVTSTMTAGDLGFGLSGWVSVNRFSVPTSGGEEVDVYNGDRDDTVVGGAADLNYTVTNWFTLGLRYSPAMRDSTATFADPSGEGISADYIQHRAFFYVDLAASRPLPLAGVAGAPGSRLAR